MDFVPAPNNEVGTRLTSSGDWVNRSHRILKKPRYFYVTCYLMTDANERIICRMSYTEKVEKADLIILMKNSFKVACQNTDQPVRLFDSYITVSA